MLMPNSSFSILALDGRLHPAAPLKREVFSPLLYTPATCSVFEDRKLHCLCRMCRVRDSAFDEADWSTKTL